jgi:cardiolipin synthase
VHNSRVVAEGVAVASDAALPPSPTAVTTDGNHSFHNVFLQVLPYNTIRQQFTIQQALVQVLDNALDYVLITNPFLIPPPDIKRALLDAGRRGVQVRLILGGKSDTPFMRWSSNHIYHLFLAHPSIHIFEFQPRILHAKTITVDGLYSACGSFNLDFLSSHKLLEVQIAMVSTQVAHVMETQFDIDLKDCVQITKESLQQRSLPQKALHWFAYHCSRLVYAFLK